MLYLIVLGTFGVVLTGTLIAYRLVFGERIAVAQRVEEVTSGISAREQELSLPLYERAIKPYITSLTSFLTRLVPAAREENMAQKMIEAGNPGNLAPREMLVIKYLLAAGCGVFLWACSGLLQANAFQSLLLAAVGVPLGWLAPDYFLRFKAQQRKQDVEKNLPDVLDLLTVSVEAGLGFDGALMKVVEQGRGVLADEFAQLLQEQKMGKPRQEALRALTDRVAVDDLSNFVGSVILADRLGISIGNILRTQSEQMRQKRRQRAEEKGMKAPVKMMIPMVLFIFPAIFVILLGPAFMKIMENLKL